MIEKSQNQKLIIVIDDDPVMRLSCSKILQKDGFCVETYEDGEQGLARIREQKPDLLVVDLKMPKMGGIEVIARLQEINPEICIIVITGYATIGTAVEAMKAGAYDFLPKPFTPDELRLIVDRGLERSELARQSRKLKAEKEKIERRFISFVSHQLQSPLAAVQQYLEVLIHLEDMPDNAVRQKEWIERSLLRIREMRAIVRDWLTISKIESGQLVGQLAPISIPPIIDDIIQCYETRAREKNITLISELSDDLSSIEGHDECLRMLFSNLISNAIKYNKPNGTVKVTAKEDAENVFISVTDTGIGIPQNKLEAIFEEFYRVKDETTKHISGTGLGLPICKKIATELGGSVAVSSKKNQGSTFTVGLPKKIRSSFN